MDPNTSISTWTKFHVPPSAHFDAPALLQPLMSIHLTIDSCHFGRIDESPEYYLLVIAWRTPDALDSFKKSPACGQLLAVMTSYSDQPPTEFVIDFGRCIWWPPLGRNTDLRIVYFPKSTSQETREAIRQVRPLLSQMTYRSDHPDAIYRSHPINGWLDGLQTWQGEEVAACLWGHFWTSRAREENFKKTGKTVRPDDSELLVSERFDEDLKNLGALGWDEFHVDLQDWVPVMWPPDYDEDDEENEEDEKDEDKVRGQLSEASLS